MDLGYDGTDFSGWAAQPGRRTVAGVLTDTLTRLAGPDGVGNLTAAGRTDAGVHATGQVCHLDLSATRWAVLGGTLVHRLSGLLPPDIRVFAADRAPDGFDARFSALYRRYEYRVADDPWGAPPLRYRDTYSWPRPLDLAALAEASTALLGEHDFAAFCRRKEQATTIRAVTELSWRRDRDGIVVATIQADAFCWSMVRSLVGALLPVGDGRKPASWPGSLLRRTERANEVVVAAAHGLTLVAVGYPSDPAELVRRANQTRQRRT
jgi:tRNA pseudouridine38-40 synthase